MDKILSAQTLRSKEVGGKAVHDEHFFIVIHQGVCVGVGECGWVGVSIGVCGGVGGWGSCTIYCHAPIHPTSPFFHTIPAFSILPLPSVYELWFKQTLVELESVIAIMGAHTVAQKDLLAVVSRLNRVIQIMKVQFDLCK